MALSGALDDIDKAILLSGGVGEVGRQAFAQRALLRKLSGDDEAAVNDFRRAAELGCPLSKEYLVRSNPYAALCNDMMAKLFMQARMSN